MPKAAKEKEPQLEARRVSWPCTPAPEVGGTDMVTQLENLKKLLDEGVLTQAEFDVQKQKLLASS